MKLIAHRKNTVLELKNTSVKYGIEVDVRSFGEELVTHHDPFIRGENFEDWLAEYRHHTLILNVKEEGLENRLLSLMQRHSITDFFFLDQSFPFLVKWARQGERRGAVRVSEFESVETALTLAGQVNWIWVDCFTRLALTQLDAERLLHAGFKLCLVSPELHGRDASDEIPKMVNLLHERKIKAEAVCTKRPDIWEQLIPCV